MRSRLVALLALLVLVVAAAPANAAGFFTDDDNSVHVRAIEAIADAGITRGCNPPVNDLFCPADSVTREQMATFLVRALGLPAGAASFTDIGSSVHAANIEALAAAGITKGCNPPDNTLFCPTDPVTREQMATFLVRALGLPAGAASFTDIGSSVHAANIEALAAAGITKGCNPPDNTLFCPTDPVTRAQMATFLARALHLDVSPRVVAAPAGGLIDLPFGSGEAETVDELTALFGAPTEDMEWKCPYFLPDANMRLVRWGSLVAVIRTVDNGDGPIGLAGWRYKLDSSAQPEPGGPAPEYVEIPFGLQLGDTLGDAVAAGGDAIRRTDYYIAVDFDYFTVEGSGISADPNLLIDGVRQGVGFDCE